MMMSHTFVWTVKQVQKVCSFKQYLAHVLLLLQYFLRVLGLRFVLLLQFYYIS